MREGECPSCIKTFRPLNLIIHECAWYERSELIPCNIIPYSLKFLRIKYFVVWVNSAQKQIFAEKNFVVERESSQVHMYVYNKY